MSWQDTIFFLGLMAGLYGLIVIVLDHLDRRATRSLTFARRSPSAEVSQIRDEVKALEERLGKIEMTVAFLPGRGP